ncbi:DUF6538 domain-containing protein [Zavarzinia sp. CC-PAN008]|uniref:DUF6538 domain-containing protein n=1 Tax=Zavarzinia sp. CC-PAN008 TaxID=3243332 RepID=UPI003F74A8CF
MEEVAKVPGLVRRGDAFAYRRRVPDRLRSVIGKREVVQALKTRDPRKARELARIAAVRADELFRQAERTLTQPSPAGPVSDDDLQDIARALLFDLEKPHNQPPTAPVAIEDWLEVLEQDIATLSGDHDAWAPSIQAQATALAADRRLILQPVAPEFARLADLVRRANIEHARRALDRARGEHGDAAHDPLFREVSSLQPPAPRVRPPTVADMIDRFEKDPTRSSLTDSAGKKYVLTFRALREIVGDSRPITDVTRADCAAVQDVLARLPRNMNKLDDFRGLSLKEAAALAEAKGTQRLSPGTLRVYVHTLSAFFNDAIRKGVVTDNPAQRLTQPRGTTSNGRRPFTTDELNRLFAALPKWAGTSAGRLWVPTIALWTGMRLGEIVWLTAEDVKVMDGVTVIDLSPTAERRLKTPGATRVMPIHPELERLGFLQRVATVSEAGGGRLFPDLWGKTQAQCADYFQKRFTEFLASAGLKQPRLSFHSFRHTFRDAMREAGIPIDQVRALGGWARGSGVEDRYGQGSRPSTLARELARIRFSLVCRARSDSSKLVCAP